MPASFYEKVSLTLARIARNDVGVYKDLQRYSKTRVSYASQVVKSRVKNKSAAMSAAIAVSSKDYLPYNIELLIDPSYYSKQVGKKFETVKDALDHYRETWKETKFDPHPLFDTKIYLENVCNKVTISPIDDYFTIPEYFEVQTSHLFCGKYYRETYHWTNLKNPLFHFLSSGFVERHNPVPSFDMDFYLNKYSRHLHHQKNAYLHFLSDGWKKGFAPHPLVDLNYLASQQKPSGDYKYLTENPYVLFLKGAKGNPSPWFELNFFLVALAEAIPELLDAALRSTANAFHLSLKPQVNHVDCSSRFSDAYYKLKYTDIGKMHGLYHYLRYGYNELRTIASSMPAVNGLGYEKALQIEPELLAPHQDIEALTVVGTPRNSDPVIKCVQDIIQKRGGFIPDIVYLCRGFVKGGAEKYGAKIINTIAANRPKLNILVFATDTLDMVARDWIHDAENVHVIQASASMLNLPPHLQVSALGRFLLWTDAKTIINNNSNVGWQTIDKHGRGLSNRSKIMCTLFCYDIDEQGNKVGYARNHIRTALSNIDIVITDNTCFGASLVEDFSLDDTSLEKFVTLHQFNETHVVPPVNIKLQKKHRVLWAARISRQKNVDLLRRIALAMPKTTFCLWAIGEWDNEICGGPMPNNIEVLKSEGSFSQVADKEIDAFLLTSYWEGLPTTIIEATCAGLPVISADVGGVSDLIDSDSGWLITPNDTDSFVSAINTCLDNPTATKKKVVAAQKKLLSQHSMETYIDKLNKCGLLELERRDAPFLAHPPVRRAAESKDNIPNRVEEIRIAKTKFDATICVNGHREGEIIIPTLKSTFLSYQHLLAAGFTGEMLIVLDNPDSVTRRICESFCQHKDIIILEVVVCDLGLARNAAIRAARGKYVAFMDGDDMMSENWVTQGIRAGKSFGRNVILHPASNYIFGNGNTYLYLHRDMHDPEFSASALVAENYWTAISMGPRELYLQFPYEMNQIKQGLAYEDWSWHCLTVSRGVVHKIVPNTSHFIRRKASGSLLTQTAASGALPRLYHLRDYEELFE